MTEQNLMKTIMLKLGLLFPKEVKIFRNNTGLGWSGKSRSYEGKVIISNPNPLHAGLCKGSSDLIGWTVKEVTPDMVGKKVALFTALEIKSLKGKVSEEQINFLKQVEEAGGIAGILRSEADAERIIKTRLNK